jgi:hypothetical protein
MVTERIQLTKKAFNLHKVKRETLAYAFQQIKPILKEYMEKNHILRLELNLKNKHALVLEPIWNGERDLWIRLWLDSDASSKQLRKRMKRRFQWVEYISFSDFLEDVEAWCKKERGFYDD